MIMMNSLHHKQKKLLEQTKLNWKSDKAKTHLTLLPVLEIFNWSGMSFIAVIRSKDNPITVN